MNNYDPLSEFDYEKPYRSEDIYNELAPGRDTLNESMLSIAFHQWKDGKLKFKIIWNSNEHTWELFPNMKEDHP